MYKLKIWSAATAVELVLSSAYLLDEDNSEVLVEQHAIELGRQVDQVQK